MKARGDPDGAPLFRAPQTTAEVELNPEQARLAAMLRRERGDDVADDFIAAVVGARTENARRDWRRATDPLRAASGEELRQLLLDARDATGARRIGARARLRDLCNRATP